ncbi:MAG: Asp/Glu/hydantoin racemase [Rhodoplanes sp.]|uniref:aspartate/glutamate racemase family protein n=1 Tax=Rhodoplanes sp. TaxID=1968906 RepID=UPI0017F83990|nr:aspartate/glutamate racemase family protein [Rhodoplanes sp.]NVO17756.1 Asp/Glu/hydantoin racemase [Rhodoplanes sp.]
MSGAARRRRILVINPNTSERVTAILLAEARRIAGDEAEVDGVTASFGAASIECRAELVIAAHAVLEAIAAAGPYDAAIIAAFGDPGLEAATEIAPMPVIGLARAGLRAAAADGRRFAIVTLGRHMRQELERAAAAAGVADRLVAIRFLDGGVLDLAHERARFLDAMVDAAASVVAEHGAAAVLFGGAPFAGVGRDLAGRIAVPVFEGLGCAMHEALALPRASSRDLPQDVATKPSVKISSALAGLIHRFFSRRVPD